MLIVISNFIYRLLFIFPVVKARLHTTLQKNEDFDAQDYEILARGGSLGSKSIYKAMKFVRNPTKMCERIANLIADMLHVIKVNELMNE